MVAYWSPEVQDEFIKVWAEYGIKDMDTAYSYPESEKALGEKGFSSKYIIHTKAKGWAPGVMTTEGILESAAKSFKELQTDSVETYFLHSPDEATPISETMAAVQQLYKEGKFKHFGLSNFLPADVQELYDVCIKNSYVLPTVYQGHYNPVGRHSEKELFPLLRKLNISFYAYAALAGGFLTKSAKQITDATPEDFRWDPSTRIGQLYQSLYNRPKLLQALTEWEDIAKEAGCSKAELSYRWVAFNSQLSKNLNDGIVVGASSPEQLKQTMEGLKHGPLSDAIAKRIDGVWETVKDEAAIDNFNR